MGPYCIATSTLGAPAADVFRWHQRRGAFARLTPPWEDVTVQRVDGAPLKDGTEVHLSMRLGALHMPWVARHEGHREGRCFRDIQQRGPFKYFAHDHLFEDVADGCRYTDRIEFQPPLGALGRLVGGGVLRHKLARMLRYRHDTLAWDLARHAQLVLPRKVAITGASGLIGSQLSATLSTAGTEVIHLVRRVPRAPWERRWDPDQKLLDPEHLSDVDAVIHLAGESIVGRWSAAKKQRIRESRIRGTTLLAEALASNQRAGRGGPGTLLTASAVGIYGSDLPLDAAPSDEHSPQGTGFLAEIVNAWEQATEPAKQAGLRVAHLRLGIVLSPRGGALRTMLPASRMGVAGPLGNGRQWLSFIGLDDAIDAFLFALSEATLSGAINVVAPEAVQQKALMASLGRVLNRPACLPFPAALLRLALGEAADEMLLASLNVKPKKLLDAGFRFRTPSLEATLRHSLGRYDAKAEHAAAQSVIAR